MNELPRDPDRFDVDGLFDEDYLLFYEPWIGDEASDHEAALILGLLELAPASRVLDLACGHGRIAVRLAALGHEVTGIDTSTTFLERARRDAVDRGVEVDWVEDDMRTLAIDTRFDAVVHWFTSFGYFDDATNRDVLRRIRDALVPGGRLVLETMNLHQVVFDTATHSVKRAPDGVMADERDYDPISGRQFHERTIVRTGREPRSLRFSVRLFTFTELRGWLEDAGFVDVAAYGGDGEDFTVDSLRLVVVARRANEESGST